MCPGIRPATGWIAYFTSTPSPFEKVPHPAQRMLRLRDRHAVARYDDHPLGVLHDERRILRRALLDRPRLRGTPGRPGALAPEPAEDHRHERAVHALAHNVGQ